MLVTARAGEAAALEGLAAGANDYVTKTFSARELVARVGAQIQVGRVRGRILQLDAYRVALFQALDGLTDPLAIEGTACRVVGQWFGVEYAVYGEFEDEGANIVIRRDYHAAGEQSRAGRFPTAMYGRRFWDVLREGRALPVTDVEEDSAFDDAERAGWRAAQIRAALAVPVVEEGKTVTYIGISSRPPRAWTDFDIQIVRETAYRTREVIRRARAEAALRRKERSEPAER